MGSDKHYPEERPVNKKQVEGFWIDSAPVTNREFRQFVDETGYITLAEKPPDPEAYPEIPSEQLNPGSAVFIQPEHSVDMSNPLNWWEFIRGAGWLHPQGPESNIENIEDHPVVHIAYTDALAYAEWAGKHIPTETEWEYAARGGLESAEFSWGVEQAPNGEVMANIWYGTFPTANLKTEAPGTTPVKSYAANNYGLFDMCGNVWEWTSDLFENNSSPKSSSGTPSKTPGCCPPSSFKERYQKRVIKGGSFLCSENYCSRYRPSARIPETEDSSTNHLGLRCIRR